jgi:2-polyprenyl-6-methoxyphenol hydroxylase-like FAD-dependent oxidoreductase
MVGLCTALLLGRDGHDVTVLERDPVPPPDPREAWTAWERRGVNQFRMLHYLQPRFRALADAHLPDVTRALADEGALRYNPFRTAPAEVTGGFRERDAQFDALTARRPVAEAAVARVVEATDHVTVRRGVAVAGLVTDGGHDGIPHVVGVRTDGGEELRADLVVDAAGRRSVLPAWLRDAGAREPQEEHEDCGFIYWGRHFRSNDGSTPPSLGPLLMGFGTISTLTLPADNGTWGLGLVTSSKDTALRALKDVDTWTRVVKALPLVAHWLDGEPLDDGVAVMAKIEDRHRTFVIDGAPVATGVLAVGDSWACTNPSVGRGISIGMIHAVALRDMLHDADLGDAVGVARRWHDVTRQTVEPWYRGTLAFDRGRLDEIHAAIEGRDFEPDRTYETTMALQAASRRDPELLRAFMRIAAVLDLPEQVLGGEGVLARIVELGSDWREQPLPGPSREELLATVAS